MVHLSDCFWQRDELIICLNHCDWKGTVDELDHPDEDVYECPKCGGSTDMMLSADEESR